MATLLQIDSSAAGAQSHSKALAEYFAEKWKNNRSGTKTLEVNLAADQPPHIDGNMIGAMYTKPDQRDEQQTQTLALSEQYLEQLRETDSIVISSPMYNFGIPSVLKAYLDHVTRVGETFVYGENGPEGLLKNKKAYLFISSGGNYTQPPLDQMNFVTPYLKTVLGFIGITDITVFETPNMGMGDEAVAKSIENTKAKIDEIFAA
ncbi:FMN-dependent NADH-azoreductase [Thiomicrorhabdus heinhorstiae]|uniref:FMN dependent NADH:quinone oxidoreductase n=1 Tax=Thiomicrorhabdus heinhorstiae TaxID=2748010 RepID=A0ABS0BT76_9GAMM|nr:NAD(P)H-dependent oxidoreductase [Thiomicrorhabdus heinhorstiae]MBF6057060.1 NAD(P)H-dependent oxidoreductase [Thiomicrorhabdus heinhorstiae]